MDKVVQYNKEDIQAIETDLEELSLQLINILNKYKADGLIDDNEYKQHVEVKENFLTYLENKRKDDQ